MATSTPEPGPPGIPASLLPPAGCDTLLKHRVAPPHVTPFATPSVNHLWQSIESSAAEENSHILRDVGSWVAAVGRSAPPLWHGCFLNVPRLAALLLAPDDRTAGNDVQGPDTQLAVTSKHFFEELEENLRRVSLDMCRHAGNIVGVFRTPAAFRVLRAGISSRFKDLQGTQRGIFLHAQWCIYCAAVNHATLFILLLIHGKLNGEHESRQFQERCLKVGCDSGEFMMSPMMSEVKAIYQMLQLRKLWPSTIQTAFFTAGTDLRCESVRNACVQSFKDLREGLECKCPICLDIMYNPVGLPCGHNFCAGCLFSATGIGNVLAPTMELYLALMVRDGSKSCPTCRQDMVRGRPIQMKCLDALIQSRYPKEWRAAHKNWKKRDSELFSNLHEMDKKAGIVEWSFIPRNDGARTN